MNNKKRSGGDNDESPQWQTYRVVRDILGAPSLAADVAYCVALGDPKAAEQMAGYLRQQQDTPAERRYAATREMNAEQRRMIAERDRRMDDLRQASLAANHALCLALAALEPDGHHPDALKLRMTIAAVKVAIDQTAKAHGSAS